VTRAQEQRDGQAPVTGLSRLWRELPTNSGLLGLAWRSLLLVSIMLAQASCIVADPPEYRAPGQTRPVLNVYGAVPTATRALMVYPADATVGIAFTVGVRSEDAGDPLRALLWLDYQLTPANGQAGGTRQAAKTIPASTYDNPGREIQFTWHPMVTEALKGCHFLSLVVAHRESFLSDEDHLQPGAAEDDAAIVTWTVNIDPVDERTLVNCPTADTSVQ
jgi:hypothetical protein